MLGASRIGQLFSSRLERAKVVLNDAEDAPLRVLAVEGTPLVGLEHPYLPVSIIMASVCAVLGVGLDLVVRLFVMHVVQVL